MNTWREFGKGFFLRHQARLSGLRRMPLIGPLTHKLSHRLISPDGRVWVQVREEPARGLWLELNPRTGSDYYEGRVELAVQTAMQEQLQPGMVFYDIGANIGFFSLLAARIVGPAGKVFGFEPERGLLERLKRHAERNALSNIAVIERAVWVETGSVRFARATLPIRQTTGSGTWPGRISPKGAWKSVLSPWTISSGRLRRRTC